MVCICGKPSKYKCVCSIAYCSVPCYKAHKDQCPGRATPAAATLSLESPADDGKLILSDELQYLLKFPALKSHLAQIMAIVENDQLSGEQTPVGRQEAALNRIKALRTGGSEENELFEEFSQAVLSHLSAK